MTGNGGLTKAIDRKLLLTEVWIVLNYQHFQLVSSYVYIGIVPQCGTLQVSITRVCSKSYNLSLQGSVFALGSLFAKPRC